MIDPAPGSPLVRNYLPGDVADFAGRRSELARLLDEHPGATRVEVLDGMAGVGKTALAVHAAHRLVGRYPAAQLFIDLHGHTPGQQPVTATAALDMLLRALGVPSETVPNELDARAARWRAELASRPVLVVLDNAADAAQVRPLLPGSARSLTLVTSRRRLVDLETARTTPLDVLDETDAVTLFTEIVGADRLTGQADDVREVVAHCGHLPLAIRIAAARLRSRPVWTVRYLADRLRQAHSPLTELATGNRSVPTAFALSYEHLDTARKRMFRLLGVHPGPDIDIEPAAALAAVDDTEAGRILECLVDDNLLAQPVAGRYQLHDLVRRHAQTVARTEEPDTARREAIRRVIDFYLHTAYRASRLLDKQYPPIDLAPPAPGCVPLTIADNRAAMAWFDRGNHSILAMQAAAEEQGWDTTVWQLAWTLDTFHYRRGLIHDNIASWQAGLAAAERLGDVAVQARAHRRLGLVYAPIGQQDTALDHLDRSLKLSEQIGDLLGQAGAMFVLALAWTHHGDYQQALTRMTNARDLYREIGDSKWEVRALSMMGACHTRLGHSDAARHHCESALRLSRRHDDTYGEADSLVNLGALATEAGRHTEAVRHHEQALALWEDLDHTYRQAGTLATLGDAHHDLGHHDQARRAWQRAIDLYRDQKLESAVSRIEARMSRPTTDLTPARTSASLLDRAHRTLLCGRLTEAESLLDQAVELARTERNPLVLAEAALGVGGMWVNKHRGRADRARTLAGLDEALAGLPRTADVLRHRVTTRHAAELAYENGTTEQMRFHLEQARRLGDPLVLAEALSLCHHALLRPEHGEHRLAMADELIAVASAAGSPLLTLTGVCRRTIDLFHLGDPRAERSLGDLRRHVDRLNSRGMLFFHSAMEVMTLIRAGRLARAEEHAAACFRLGTEVGDPDAPVFHSVHLFAIRWLQGRGAELVDLADRIANSPLLPDTELTFHSTLALLAIDAGQQDRARSALHRLTADGLAAVPPSSTWLACMFTAIEVAAALDEPDIARSAHDLLAPFAALPVVPSMAIVCFGSTERSLGLAALTFGEPDRAVDHLDRAVTANIHLANRPLTAMARADLAGALLRRSRPGDRARAIDLLDLAIAEATAMGMTVRADSWAATRRTLSHAVTISRDGTRWRLNHDGREALVYDLVGMRYLARLVANPGAEIPALDLVSEFTGAQPSDHAVIDTHARTAYLERAQALAEELAEARRDGDHAVVDRLEGELDALTTELRTQTGLHGRPRQFGGPAERARTAVRKAITRAIDAVDAVDPEAAAALRASVTTGYRCAYLPH